MLVERPRLCQRLGVLVPREQQRDRCLLQLEVFRRNLQAGGDCGLRIRQAGGVRGLAGTANLSQRQIVIGLCALRVGGDLLLCESDRVLRRAQLGRACSGWLSRSDWNRSRATCKGRRALECCAQSQSKKIVLVHRMTYRNGRLC
jgi:hypothetical protein